MDLVTDSLPNGRRAHFQIKLSTHPASPCLPDTVWGKSKRFALASLSSAQLCSNSPGLVDTSECDQCDPICKAVACFSLASGHPFRPLSKAVPLTLACITISLALFEFLRLFIIVWTGAHIYPGSSFLPGKVNTMRTETCSTVFSANFHSQHQVEQTKCSVNSSWNKEAVGVGAWSSSVTDKMSHIRSWACSAEKPVLQSRRNRYSVVQGRPKLYVRFALNHLHYFSCSQSSRCMGSAVTTSWKLFCFQLLILI